MRYKCLIDHVSPTAFIEHSFVLPGQRIVCFIDDFKEHPNYHQVSSKDIELTETKASKVWLSLGEKIKADMSRRRVAALKEIRRDGDDEWDCLVIAAEEHKAARYRNDSVPFEIELKAKELSLAPMKTSLKVLAEATEVENKINRVKQLFLESFRAIDEKPNDGDLFYIYTSFKKNLEKIAS